MNADFVTCPKCQARWKIKPEMAGWSVRCSRCGEVFGVPAKPKAAPARSPSPGGSGTTAGRPPAARAHTPSPDIFGAAATRPVERRSHAAPPDVFGDSGTSPPSRAHADTSGVIEASAVPQPGEPPAVGDLGLVSAEEVLAGEAAGNPASDTACPGCGRTLAPSAVICVACGFDRRTGRRVGMRHE